MRLVGHMIGGLVTLALHLTMENVESSKYVIFKIFYIYVLAKLNCISNFSLSRHKIMFMALTVFRRRVQGLICSSFVYFLFSNIIECKIWVDGNYKKILYIRYFFQLAFRCQIILLFCTMLYICEIYHNHLLFYIVIHQRYYIYILCNKVDSLFYPTSATLSTYNFNIF